MHIRFWRFLALAGVLVLLAGSGVQGVRAQDGQRYENPSLGIAFDLPAGWEVAAGERALLAGAPNDLVTVQAGGVPQGLVLRLTFGTFNELGIVDATELPDLLARLATGEGGAPAPEQAQWGNGSGYHTLMVDPNEGLTVHVALLAVAGGRVAVVRGMAPTAIWDAGAGAQFDGLVQSLTFSLPVLDQDYMERIVTNDGGVMWHYQTGQPSDGRVVAAGGIVYDPFDVMYIGAGPGGVLAINMATGQYISYIGPWLNGNFVDVGIGPDTRLYLANVAEDTYNAVMVVDRAGNYNRGWGVRGDGDGEFAPNMPQTIAVTAQGEVWTVSEGHASGIANRLYKFDSFGNLLLTVDLSTLNPDLSGVRLAVNDETGAIYLTGATGNLNVIDSNGQPLVLNLGQETLIDQTPVEIGIMPDGNIVLALPAPGLDGFGFLEFSVAGQLLDAFGLPYDPARSTNGAFLPGEYLRPAGLVFGPDGMGYWVETNPDSGFTQVQAFLFTGDGRLTLGSEVPADASAPAAGSVDPAQGGGIIGYGETVHGVLNNRYPSHEWRFEGRVGDHIVITMVDATGSGILDPKIELRVADGRVIASNDDAGQIAVEGLAPRDSRLEFDLPNDGQYIILAGRFGGRGEYELTLEGPQ
ncbi:MAG: hypothetical protein GXY36_13010 [Chloroflexi bacterium]|nr:hypothetical protein [Chloroflexota bacterium]